MLDRRFTRYARTPAEPELPIADAGPLKQLRLPIHPLPHVAGEQRGSHSDG